MSVEAGPNYCWPLGWQRIRRAGRPVPWHSGSDSMAARAREPGLASAAVVMRWRSAATEFAAPPRPIVTIRFWSGAVLGCTSRPGVTMSLAIVVQSGSMFVLRRAWTSFVPRSSRSNERLDLGPGPHLECSLYDNAERAVVSDEGREEAVARRVLEDSATARGERSFETHYAEARGRGLRTPPRESLGAL